MSEKVVHIVDDTVSEEIVTKCFLVILGREADNRFYMEFRHPESDVTQQCYRVRRIVYQDIWTKPP